MRLSLWLSVDLYLTKQLHVTWNIHTKREPRLGKGSILFRKTNNNSNNKETLSSGIVLRIGLEFSRSRDSDSPTNLSMAKPVADRNAVCILIITISLKGQAVNNQVPYSHLYIASFDFPSRLQFTEFNCDVFITFRHKYPSKWCQ